MTFSNTVCVVFGGGGGCWDALQGSDYFVTRQWTRDPEQWNYPITNSSNPNAYLLLTHQNMSCPQVADGSHWAQMRTPWMSCKQEQVHPWVAAMIPSSFVKKKKTPMRWLATVWKAGVDFLQGQGFFSSAASSEWLLGTITLLPSGYREAFPQTVNYSQRIY
jgi:hypothetical protein